MPWLCGEEVPRVSWIEATPRRSRKKRMQGDGNELAESMRRPESPTPGIVLTGPAADGPCGV